jgi:hypothetical protein
LQILNLKAIVIACYIIRVKIDIKMDVSGLETSIFILCQIERALARVVLICYIRIKKEKKTMLNNRKK